MNDKNSSEPQEIMVDKERFDAVLRKIVNSKPLPLKDVSANLTRTRKSKPAND